jgi:hypothetical protein
MPGEIIVVEAEVLDEVGERCGWSVRTEQHAAKHTPVTRVTEDGPDGGAAYSAIVI